ncbi:uncharacterized protein RJT20DRAFT_128311 [Scheffersomyces xylosifermentans]|uniref:uncharacterized protein n=1 Tax=Scheffersomyces xylosifermentans TaxID=1304137 RepID=UPI00315CA286
MATKIAVSKTTKMSDLIHYRLKISTIDNRYFIGSLLAFDKHLNLVLSDTEESRITKKSISTLKKNAASDAQNAHEPPTFEKRSLGLIILRGEQIVSLSIESPPPLDPKKRLGLEKGRGISKPLKTPVSVKARKNLTAPSIKRTGGSGGFRRQ